MAGLLEPAIPQNVGAGLDTALVARLAPEVPGFADFANSGKSGAVAMIVSIGENVEQAARIV